MKKDDLTTLSKKASVLEKEILKLEKQGLVLAKKAITLENRLSVTLSKAVALEKAEIAEAKSIAEKREKVLQKKISNLKSERALHERKRDAFKQVKIKSSQIRVELKRIQAEILAETAGLNDLSKLKKLAIEEEKIEKKAGLQKKALLKIKQKQVRKKPQKKPAVKRPPLMKRPVVKRQPLVEPKPLPKKIAPPKPSEPARDLPKTIKEPVPIPSQPKKEPDMSNPFAGLPVRKEISKKPVKETVKTVAIKKETIDIKPRPVEKQVPGPAEKKPIAVTPFGLDPDKNSSFEKKPAPLTSSKPGAGVKQNPLFDPGQMEKNKGRLKQDFGLSEETEKKLAPKEPEGIPIKKIEEDLETLEELEAKLAAKTTEAGSKAPEANHTKPNREEPFQRTSEPAPKPLEQKPVQPMPTKTVTHKPAEPMPAESPEQKPVIHKPFEEKKEIPGEEATSKFAEENLIDFSSAPISLKIPAWGEPKEKQVNALKAGQKGDFVFAVSVEESNGKAIEDLVSEKASKIETNPGSKVIERKETLGHVFLVYTTSKGFATLLHKGMFIMHDGKIYSVFFSAPEEKFKDINDTFWKSVKSISFG